VAVDESRLERTAYARLVRKGGGEAAAVASLEADARVRSSLADDSGACAGAALGLAVALRSFTLTPRLGWCRSGFTNTGIAATVDQYDLEFSATHYWDLRIISLQFGLTLGGSLIHQHSRTQGFAPPRTTAALQLSPMLGITRDISERYYLFLTGSAATYLFRTEDSLTSKTSFGPSFAVRTALGVGLRL
jgi:hypothetical protein